MSRRMKKETREYLEALNEEILEQRKLVQLQSDNIYITEDAVKLKNLERELHDLKHFREEFIITARNFNQY